MSGPQQFSLATNVVAIALALVAIWLSRRK